MNPLVDTDVREIFYYVLFHILNFELCEGIVYSFKGEGLHRYDLKYSVIKVKLKWFRYTHVIFFYDSLICCKLYQPRLHCLRGLLLFPSFLNTPFYCLCIYFPYLESLSTTCLPANFNSSFKILLK